MNIYRWLLIGTTFAIVALLTFNFYIWSDEYKNDFLYQDNYLAYIMAFVLIIAVTGIFKWFLKEEIVLTDPKRKRRRR